MNPPPLEIERLAVDRIGSRIRRGAGFELESLSPRINLVHGPNGSGKSTLAMLIQELLWPGASGLERPTAAAVMRAAEARWQIELEAGHRSVRRDGVPGEGAGGAPAAGPPEHRFRYRLALDELVAGEDAGFAGRIARESQGGYDVEAAAAALGFEANPRSPRGLARELEAAAEAVRQARDRQVAVSREAERLRGLKAEREAAVQAAATLQQLEKARAYVQADEACRQIEAKLAALPEGVARLRGDERERLAEIAEQRDELLRRAEQQQDRRRRAEAELAEAALPGEGLAPEAWRRMKADRERFAQLEGERRHADRERAEAEAHAGEARARLGGGQFGGAAAAAQGAAAQGAAAQGAAAHGAAAPGAAAADGAAAGGAQDGAPPGAGSPEEASAPALAAADVEALEELARQAHELEAKVKVCAERRRRLEAAAPEAPDALGGLSREMIRQGLGALARWLATPPPSPTPLASSTAGGGGLATPLAIGVAAALIALLALVLAVVHTPAWLAACAVALIVPGVAWWARRREAAAAMHAEAGERAAHRKTYERLSDLAPPEAWEAEPVAARLGELITLAERAEAEAERARQRRDLEAEEQELAAQRKTLEARRQALAEKLGLTLEIGPAWLPLLAGHLRTWQQQRDRVAAAAARLEAVQSERAALLERLNASLAAAGLGPAESAEEAGEAVRELETRREQAGKARHAIEEARRDLEEVIEPERARLEAARRQILQRLGLLEEAEPEAALDAWLDRRAEFRELQKRLTQKEGEREGWRASLPEQTQLLALEAEALEGRIREASERAGRAEELTREIASIETRVAEAKRGHDLTEALEQYDSVQAKLEAAREAGGRAAVGAVLAEWVRRETLEQTRPAVFRRAGALLARFTAGALELTLDESADPPVFLARDAAAGTPPRPVTALSVGERMQLLMAVRLAFLEQEERLRLPLLIDEALGTSDTARAASLMESIIEIARQGRQVFYFTAQLDELAKWEAKLEEAGVDHRVIDLAGVRGRSVARARPLALRQFERPDPPAPEGRAMAAYGRALGVPAPDPRIEPVSAAHLWYLVDEPRTLHALLREGITTWGELQLLFEHGGAEWLAEVAEGAAGEAGLRARAEAAARALEAGFEAWRIGRGKPVDRAVLEDSGHVTEAFIDRVSELAREVGGDGAALMAAIEAGEVKRWQSRKTPELRAYLEDHGYLAGDAPLTPASLRLRILAASGEDLAAGRIARAHVERIAAALAGGPSAVTMEVESP